MKTNPPSAHMARLEDRCAAQTELVDKALGFQSRKCLLSHGLTVPQSFTHNRPWELKGGGSSQERSAGYI